MAPRRITGIAASILMISAFSVAGASSALAHSGLVSTTPANDAVLNEAPSSISFTFDEELLADADSISLNAADGTNVVSAKVEPTGKTVELPWPSDLPAGDYQAAYRVVSADGHPVTGAISFTYAPADAAASAAPASAAASPATSVQPSGSAIAISNTTEPESTGGNPWLGLGIGVVIGLVLVVLFAAMRRKRA
jgi:methionine-rich copper-binding protein CopC